MPPLPVLLSPLSTSLMEFLVAFEPRRCMETTVSLPCPMRSSMESGSECASGPGETLRRRSTSWRAGSAPRGYTSRSMLVCAMLNCCLWATTAAKCCVPQSVEPKTEVSTTSAVVRLGLRFNPTMCGFGATSTRARTHRMQTADSPTRASLPAVSISRATGSIGTSVESAVRCSLDIVCLRLESLLSSSSQGTAD